MTSNPNDIELSMTSPSSLDDNNKNKKKKVPLHAIRILPYDETCPTKYKNARWWSIFAFVIAILGQWANCLLLPSIYNRLTDSLGFDASQLGLLHAMRLFSMFGSLPLHAYLSQFYHRGRLMSLSLIVGGFVTMLNVIGLTFTTFMILNMLAGCSLGMVVPVTRSLIPNYYRLEDRGSAFGILEVAGGLGRFVGAGMGVIITRYTQPFGQVREIYDLALLNTNVTWEMWITNRYEFSNATAMVANAMKTNTICCLPWQTDFFILGTMTVVLGIVVFFLVRDPVQETGMRDDLGSKLVLVFEGMEKDNDDENTIKISDMKTVAKNITWRCIATQGAVSDTLL
jgi:sugar phosphate permease